MKIQVRKPFFPDSSILKIQTNINKSLKIGRLSLGKNVVAIVPREPAAGSLPPLFENEVVHGSLTNCNDGYPSGRRTLSLEFLVDKNKILKFA